MLRTVGLVVVAALAASALGGCDKAGGGKAGSEFATKVDKNTYHNDRYKMTATSPDGWYVMSSSETKRMQETGAQYAAGDNKEFKAQLDAAKDSAGAIFSFFRDEPGKKPVFNPSVAAAAENVSAAPDVKTGKDYFEHLRQLLAQSQVSYNIKDGYGIRVIGGQNFDRMDVSAELQGFTVKQSYYSTIRNGEAVMVIQSWDTDADKADTDKVIDSIKLDW